jgi:cell division protein FtsB
MKKLLIVTILIFLASSVYAENTKKDFSKMSDEELIEHFMQSHKKIEQYKKEVADAKAKTESIKSVGRKLDEILGVLEKNKQ